MADIIRLPKRVSPRDAAILRLSRKLLAHLTVRLYESGLHDRLPLHSFIAEMEDTLISDGVDYDPDILDSVLEDPDRLASIEKRFFDRMVRDGWLPG